MSLQKTLLISVSAIALAVAAAMPARADQNFTTNHTSDATAGGNTSNQTDKLNTNQNAGNAFKNSQGVVSELQNNGDNSALNNGNTVDATISTGVATGDLNYSATSDQTATQSSGSVVTETSVDDNNSIIDSSFQNAKGVFSKLQNNGAESAINNGNAVAAAILEGSTGAAILTATATQRATVNAANPGNSYTATDSFNDNFIRNNAFENVQGVASVVQNNGPNSALNNGNTVSAVIGPAGAASGNREFTAESLQVAAVNAANASVETNSDDTNHIGNQAFQNMQGVGSVLQNNGANSAANNGNSVAAVVTDNNANGGGAGGHQFDVGGLNSGQFATVFAVSAANAATQTDSPDINVITDNVFKGAEGVFSALQNNGPNSALNNGNMVSAVIANGTVAVNADTDFTADSTQVAFVPTNAFGTNSNDETNSADSNTIDGSAFQDPKGIVSALQNNGANSAANNGNTVSAVIAGNNVTAGAATFTTSSVQTATVDTVGGVQSSDENGSANSNTITTNAFRSGFGVISALQNNGTNSALNNGNTVSAIVTTTVASTTAATDTFTTDASQTANVFAELGGGGSNFMNQELSFDSNTLSGAAFENVQGIASVLQNNGANSAANNGNTVSAAVTGGNIGNATADVFLTTSFQAALVDGGPAVGNVSQEFNSDDLNSVSGTAFKGAEGVISAMQNNAGNSALNNGNTVSAFVSDGNVTGTGPVGFTTTSGQTATVRATGGVVSNTSSETADSGDTNEIIANAFENAQGIGSVMQNNGANSALNGGNTVSAIINGCTSCTGTLTFATTSTQTATVEAGSSDATHSVDSFNLNKVQGSAFANVAGVFSVTQNNAPNSALNNGNTVSAVIANN